jgi:hypothetical protein
MVKSGLLLGLFAAVVWGQAPAPPMADSLNQESWKRAFRGIFGKTNELFGTSTNVVVKPLRGKIYLIDEGRPNVCAVRLLEVPLPRNVEAWTPQVVPPADGYSTVEAQVPAPSCPKG